MIQNLVSPETFNPSPSEEFQRAGMSYVGQNIRGQNFEQKNLADYDFSNCIGGLSSKSARHLKIFSIFLALLSGFITAYAGSVFGQLFTASDRASLAIGALVLGILVVFARTTLKKGLGFSLGLSSIMSASMIVLIVAFTTRQDIAGQTAVSSLTLGGTIAGTTGLSTAISLTRKPKKSITIALVGILLGTFVGLSEVGVIESALGIISLSIGVIVLSSKIAQKAHEGDSRYQLIKNITVYLSTIGGTNFKNATLTDANFTGAILDNTNFRDANLSRVCWLGAKLDKANLDGTYLEDPKIRKLLVDKNGNSQNFDGMNLKSVNLEGADLRKASFIGADLSNARLNGARLEGSKLIRTQLHNADLTGACLTGAYIEDWGISPQTKRSNIDCQYIYTDDACRKPFTGKFEVDEFSEFVAPMINILNIYKDSSLKTIELSHEKDVNSIVSAIAVTKLIEKYPQYNIRLATISGGKQNIQLYLYALSYSDTSELKTYYFNTYEKEKEVSKKEIEDLFDESGVLDKELIKNVARAIDTTRGNPNVYIGYCNIIQGDIDMSQNKASLAIGGDIQGDAIGLTVSGENTSLDNSAIGNISGQVAISIGKLPDSSSPEEVGIKDILEQLRTSIENDSDLTDDEKEDALEQIKIIADAGQAPPDNGVKKIARQALRVLKATIEKPNLEQLAKIGIIALPAIAKFFGIPVP